jgi:hypothetical protein
MTSVESKVYQQALATFCTRQCPTYFVTLAFHAAKPLNINRAEACLRHFDAQLDRALLGKRWAEFPADMRTQFIALPEGHRAGSMILGLHYHLMLTPAKRKKAAVSADSLRTLARQFWSKCAPAGDVDVQVLLTDADRQRVAAYACKRIADAGSIGLERFVIAPICPTRIN